MPSLWDLLCVSRQHKYTTHAKAKRRPKEAWEDPPYYDPANVEYYIQPELPSRRRTDSIPSQASAHLVSPPPPRSPSSRRNHKVRESPRYGRRNSPAWYVEVRIPQSPTSGMSSYTGEPSSPPPPLLPPPPPPPLLSRQESRGGMSGYPGGGGYPYSGQPSFVDRSYEDSGSSTGKRRHVRDIFADMPPQQYPDDRYHQSTPSIIASASSSSSTRGQHADQAWRPSLETSLSRESTRSAPLLDPNPAPRSRQISANIQNSGYTLPADSRQNSHPGQRYPQPAHPSRQSPAYPPPPPPASAAKGSWQSSGLMPPTGARLDSRWKPPESMHQYSPRTVSDGAISAALLGSRVDDFVHDPGWNRAMERFAQSPTSTFPFPFEDKNPPRPADRSATSPRTLTPKDSDGNVTFVVAAHPRSFQSREDLAGVEDESPPQSPHTASPVPDARAERSSAQRKGLGDAGFSDREDEVFSLDMTRKQAQGPVGGFHQQSPSSGPGQEMQMLLGVDEDVLY